SLPLMAVAAVIQERRQAASALQQDYDKQKRVQTSLRRSEERYREAAEGQTNLVCRYLQDTTLTFVNGAYCRYFGRRREELIGRKFLDLIPETARQAVLSHIASLAEEPRVLNHEHEVVRPDGSIGWQQWVNYPAVTREGQILEFQAIGRDITDRKQAEEALHQSQRQLQWLMNSIEGIVSEANPGTFEFTFVSQKAERLLGYPVEQWLSMPAFWVDHLHPDDRDWAVEFCRNATDAGMQHDFEYRMIAADGRVVWLRDIVSVLVEDGRPARVQGLMIDVTQQKQAESALRDSYGQIQDLAGRLIVAQEAERARIARELHDDVNQQLAALSIALSGLRRRLPEDALDVRDELTGLQRRVVELTDDVRHLSHELHSGVLQHAGLAAALEAKCAEFRTRHALDVSFQAEDALDDVPPDVSLCLYRAAQETLQNVARHAEAHHVHVTLTRNGDDLELTVGDDGRGFDLAAARRAGGLGLISLDERVRLVRGIVM